ncbi:hypothetical protein [Alkalicoccus daliensis]|nr:hypothetical protein [Alkalicoccus daliensis]
MLTKQRTTAKELVQKWVEQQKNSGRTEQELRQTMFVYGDEVMEIDINEHQELHVKEKEDIIVFRKPEPEPGHICRCCTMEYDTEKDALQCCAYID